MQRTITSKHRPLIIITSNNEKELPDAFLRRCFFHFIQFPERDTMRKIVDVHFPDLDQKLFEEAMKLFYQLREVRGMKKKPSTSELIDWIKLLLLGKVGPEELGNVDLKAELPPYTGSLVKNEQDLQLLLARMGVRSRF